eukprot:TRINITY_DN7340_c0_g1_i2.p1 TRINITY_DN7340_c0_g1~~TRINITY_DN7340_c0_g1_i2.p1  ORF type:complete len:262 (-),score=41.43 TRINITY_DN7340_c0_g1_i2:52-837(-)
MMASESTSLLIKDDHDTTTTITHQSSTSSSSPSSSNSSGRGGRILQWTKDNARQLVLNLTLIQTILSVVIIGCVSYARTMSTKVDVIFEESIPGVILAFGVVVLLLGGFISFGGIEQRRRMIAAVIVLLLFIVTIIALGSSQLRDETDIETELVKRWVLSSPERRDQLQTRFESDVDRTHCCGWATLDNGQPYLPGPNCGHKDVVTNSTIYRGLPCGPIIVDHVSIELLVAGLPSVVLGSFQLTMTSLSLFIIVRQDMKWT